MKRRQFLVASTLSVALLAALPGCSGDPAAGASSRVTYDPAELDTLAGRITGFDGEGLPAGADAQAARSRLLERAGAAGSPGQGLASALQAVIEDDHAQGRTQEIDGWVLAETELDLLVYSASLHQLAGTTTRMEAVTGATAAVQEFVAVKAWGPQRACAGSGFNVQSDGHSSIWMQVSDDAPAGLVVLVGGREVRTTQASGLLTTRFDPPDIERDFGEPGKVLLELFHPGRGIKQAIGEFTVAAGGAFATTTSGKTSTTFREVEGWGPTKTRPGEAFNPQPSGDSALWIKTSCAPPDTRVRFGTQMLETQVGPETVSARLRGVQAIAKEGRVPVHLVHASTGEEVLVGEFTVAP